MSNHAHIFYGDLRNHERVRKIFVLKIFHSLIDFDCKSMNFGIGTTVQASFNVPFVSSVKPLCL